MGSAIADISSRPIAASAAFVSPPRPHRPAVWIACCLAAGILPYRFLPIWAGGYAAAAMIFALLSVLLLPLKTTARILLCTAIAFTGLALAQFQRWYVPVDSAIGLVTEEPTLVRARVRIADLPTYHAPEAHRPASLSCTADLLSLYHAGQWHQHTGQLVLHIQPAMPDLSPGQTLETLGMLARIAGPDNPGQYNWQEHFARNNIALRFNVTGDGLAKPIGPPSTNWLWPVRIAVRNALISGFDTDHQLDAALLRTLLLGDNSDLLEQTWADFRASGTAHHLSISGMHIAALSGLVYLLCRLTMRHPRTAVLIAVSFALFYGLLTRPSPPIWRSVFLCIAVGASLVLRRNTDPIQCLFVAVLVMLAWKPLDLFNPGFQLSFGTVAGLMLFSRPVANWFWSFEHEHDRMARIIRPPTGLSAVRHWMISSAIAALSAGLVAYAISMPLIAWHFQQINPWAIPGSILLAPLVTFALFAGLAKIILSLLIPPASTFLAAPAAVASHALRSTVAALAHLPDSQFAIPPLAPWVLLCCTVLLLAPVLPKLCTWRHSRWLPALAVFLVLLTPLLAQLGRALNHDDLRATLLSVGNGGCAIIELPAGRTIMVDCGATMRPDLYEQTIAPFLLSRGLTHIDQVFITHGDNDHTSALPDVKSHFTPKVFTQLHAGQSISSDVDILAPPATGNLIGNDASSVFRFHFAGRTILFTGDIQESGIQSLLTSRQSLQADILIAPHHGSSEQPTSELITRVNPQWIICSSSPRLSHKQHLFDQITQDRASKLLRTGKSGAVTITIAHDGTIHVIPFHP